MRSFTLLRGALLVWLVFAFVCATEQLWGMRNHGHSPLRIYFCMTMVWWGWALATPLIAALGRWKPIYPFSLSAVLLHVGFSVIFTAAHQLWWNAMIVFIRPYDAMGPNSLWPLRTTDLFLELTIYFAVLGATWALEAQHLLRERQIAAAKLEASLAQARLHALELQLQPHFLFNTLHAIGGLVRQSRGTEAIEMIAGLSDLLRYSLDRSGSAVSLEREVAILQRYLDIQRIRFPDRLQVRIDLPAELKGASVPGLILQPLAENAVRHGIEPLARGGEIQLCASREGDRLRITLFNSGHREETKQKGLGLENTRARLSQLYGARHSFTLENDRGGVLATLTLPFELAPA